MSASVSTGTETALPPFPDEVVTETKTHIVEPPGGVGKAALLTLDNGRDHKRPNTFGPASLASLEAALDAAAAREDIVAVCLTGKPFVFSVGADLGVFRQLTSHEQVLEIGRLGHRVFGKLATLGVPSFAFINGASMGGGLEVALHCTYRTVSTGASAIALPEVFLGLIPGWGGATLLPRIAGPNNAVTVIVENPLNNNRMLKPKQAVELGVADAMFEAADFVEQSLAWAAAVVKGEIAVERPSPSDDEWDAALSRAASIIATRTKNVPPAPKRALELLTNARTASLADSFAAEDHALADLTLSPELAASLYAFDLVQKRAKRPVGVPEVEPRPVTFVGVVGAGLMARQLGLLVAERMGIPVHLVDVDDEAVARAREALASEIEGRLAKKRLRPDAAGKLQQLITVSTDRSQLADADVVIEAVFEDLALKRQIFAELEAIVRPDCILATNTSSLPVSAMAAGLQHPERVVGLHFFNPVAVMQLVEVVRAKQSGDEAIATAFALTKQLKKAGVLVVDSPGFVVNRVLIRLLSEVMRAVDDGADFATVDSSLDPLAFPMSPFALLELVGTGVAAHVVGSMHQAFPDRFAHSPTLDALAASGRRSVYAESGPPTIAPEVAKLVPQRDHPPSGADICDRVLRALAEEIGLMLDEGVVSSPADIDLCMVLGAGWPFWLGGITPYLDRSGVAQLVRGKPFHEGTPDAGR
ncbi:MAG TPA: 3-hydroxyacyl-CoA dehydrogenase NAD-binding domain-containing protein [Actinomycetes bacterium]|nr:3-hydroxyacyl-CoA dehydrogenase NAD-binding domain-containing protein [Actinomycetes bacterium]